ncbi:amidohydrolase family protein [Micromonospora zamorensis]|uniref:amidohydrolase family protein n=1 Tax=Micromonospora zamorensis TaxID=709883 RepID=UPI0033B26F7D
MGRRCQGRDDPGCRHRCRTRVAAGFRRIACGIPATAALAAATSVGAEVCGLGRRKGRVRPGFDADLLVVGGDPTSDISALRRPLAVYRAGDPVR